MTAEHVLEDVWRTEAPHVLAALLRRSADFGACEDAVQEALLAAAHQWPVDGVPDSPRGWLVRVASRRLVDHHRSEAARSAREERVAAETAAHAAPADAEGPPAQDDTLQLLVLCAHPALAPASQVPLTLRAVAGLSTAQIAAGFLVPEATMAQRISRAKAAIRGTGARFAAPGDADLPQRLVAVRHVLHLVFSEAYVASAGPHLTDTSLAAEAIRLAERLHAAVPDDAEITGLLALMLLTHARAPARVDGRGDLVPLAEQDRTLWDSSLVARGIALVEEVLPRGHVGPFQLEAAIAAVHAEAPDPGATDWLQITMLCRMLARAAPSPAVDLGLGIAVGMAHGPGAGLRALAHLDDVPALRRSHRLYAARAHLLELDGQHEQACAAYDLAASMTASIPEQRYLVRRATALREQQRDQPCR